jgi:hypothetical protein
MQQCRADFSAIPSLSYQATRQVIPSFKTVCQLQPAPSTVELPHERASDVATSLGPEIQGAPELLHRDTTSLRRIALLSDCSAA